MYVCEKNMLSVQPLAETVDGYLIQLALYYLQWFALNII